MVVLKGCDMDWLLRISGCRRAAPARGAADRGRLGGAIDRFDHPGRSVGRAAGRFRLTRRSDKVRLAADGQIQFLLCLKD